MIPILAIAQFDSRDNISISLQLTEEFIEVCFDETEASSGGLSVE